jgi:hypothetical protein
MKCAKESNIYILSPSADSNQVYRKVNASAVAPGHSGTYAYSSTGTYFGSAPTGPGIYAGTATYLMLKGSISTNVNTFDIAGKDKNACITTIKGQGTTTAECGKNRVFKEGHYKFSLFGYTTDDSSKNLAKILTQGAGGKYEHVSWRQLVKLVGDPSGAKVTMGVTTTAGANKDFGKMAGEDAKGFKLCVNSNCMEYTFPTTFNNGKLTGGEAVVDKDAATGTIKIKVSKPPSSVCSKCAYVDYLLPIGKMTEANWWFAYDPEVQPSTTKPGGATGGPTAKPGGATGGPTAAAPLASQLSFVAAVVAFMVACVN